MSDQKILVTRSSMPPLEEYVEEIREIWDSHWLTNMGVKHQELQNELEQYLKVEHLELLTNGHMALEMAMQAMDFHGEVITTPFTFASTTHAIVRNGAKPVFCDIDPEDFTMDPARIESLINEKTTCSAEFVPWTENLAVPEGTDILKGRQLGIDFERFIERSQIRNTTLVSIGKVEHNGHSAL